MRKKLESILERASELGINGLVEMDNLRSIIEKEEQEINNMLELSDYITEEIINL